MTITTDRPLPPLAAEAGDLDELDAMLGLVTLPSVTVPLVTAAERTWAAIRGHHPDVPPVVVTIGSGTLGMKAGSQRLGHFAAARWQVGTDQLAELFIGGEGLARDAHGLLATLLHEAAHGIAATRGIRDTSREGRYHNARFKALAEEVGLSVSQDKRIGWSPSTLTPNAAERYAEQLAELDAAMVAFRFPEPEARSTTAGRAGAARNGITAVCECDPPRRIRVRSAEMFEAAPILCGACTAPFEVEGGEGE